MIPSDFPERFRALRERLGISQRILAQRLRITEGYLSQIESGKKALDPDTPLGALFISLEDQAYGPTQFQEQAVVREEHRPEKVRYAAVRREEPPEANETQEMVRLFVMGFTPAQIAEMIPTVVTSRLSAPMRDRVISALSQELQLKLKGGKGR